MKQTEYLNLKSKVNKIGDRLTSVVLMDFLNRLKTLEKEVSDAKAHVPMVDQERQEATCKEALSGSLLGSQSRDDNRDVK